MALGPQTIISSRQTDRRSPRTCTRDVEPECTFSHEIVVNAPFSVAHRVRLCESTCPLCCRVLSKHPNRLPRCDGPPTDTHNTHDTHRTQVGIPAGIPAHGWVASSISTPPAQRDVPRNIRANALRKGKNSHSRSLHPLQGVQTAAEQPPSIPHDTPAAWWSLVRALDPHEVCCDEYSPYCRAYPCSGYGSNS